MPTEMRLDVVLDTLESEMISPSFLEDFAPLLKDQPFRHQFMKRNGFEKLSVHLVKKYETTTILKILSILSDVFHEDAQVFEYLFAQSAVLVTTLIWLLVKLRKVDAVVPAKVYGILASLPTLAKSLNFSDYEIQHMLLSSLNLYNQKSFEKIRFQHLIQSLDQTNYPPLRVEILKLINNLIRMNIGLESRISMRLEFVSLGLEVTIPKLTQSATPELQELLNEYTTTKREDEAKYIQLHTNLISPQWLEGEDLPGLIDTLSNRWSSNKQIQALVGSTLSNLLHIPNDDQFGLSSWILLNKIVTQFAVRFEQTITELDVKNSLHNIESHLEEFQIEKQALQEREHALEEQVKVIPKLQHDIQVLTSDNHKQKVQLEELTKTSKENETELKSDIADLKKSLAHSEFTLKSESAKHSQTIADKQKQINELQEKLSTTEKHYRELIAEEKILRMKMEDFEKAANAQKKPFGLDRPITQPLQPKPQPQPASPVTATPAPEAQSQPQNLSHTAPIQPQSLPQPATETDSKLSAEEQRLMKAMNRMSFGPPMKYKSEAIQRGPRPTSSTPPGKITTTQTDWKRRQLEEEREKQERAEMELLQRRKQLNPTSLGGASESSHDSPKKASSDITKETLLPIDDAAAKEEKRLERTIMIKAGKKI
eukprot:TRINITY_DN3841_c0_g1_i1.p1 TRINITY_DN3841_c0_g1~~TRINITY_DN3841_c0_g1_i1.p1  ORF type:complete len:655 (-),score=224.51 TRINITY_DN3841_c0_g1_i1:40-2004(-)